MRRLRSLALLSTAIVVLHATGVAAATPTTVDVLAATASGSAISVTGSVTFGNQDPVELVNDGCGDAPGGAAATALGLDHEKLLISQPSGGANNLLFTIDLCGLTGGGIPEGIQYNWDIQVNGGSGAGGSNWSIKTMRSRASATTNLDPYAATYTCVPSTGGYSCTENVRLTAVYDEATSQIRITVPFTAIGASPGALIEGWPRATNPFWIGPSASGATTLTNIFDTSGHDEYRVPAKTASLGIAPAGTPESGVSFSTTATISGSSFSGALAKPAAGEYDVWAKACFGTSNCATRSVAVTVA
jgi:hypothetical protein